MHSSYTTRLLNRALGNPAPAYHHTPDDVLLRGYEQLGKGPLYGLSPPVGEFSHPSPDVPVGTILLHLLDTKHRLEREIASYGALFNAERPINRLPTRLLTNIFKILQGTGVTSWIVVLAVCRHWFVAASTTPELWCDLVAIRDLSALEIGLVRSRDLGIRVTQSTHWYTQPVIVRLLTPHTHRLVQLHIEVDSESMHLFAALSYPMMTSLSLVLRLLHPGNRRSAVSRFFRSSIGIDDESSLALSREQFPTLHSLTLSRRLIAASSSILSNLHSLTIKEGTIASNTEPLFVFLKACQELESLELVDLQYDILSCVRHSNQPIRHTGTLTFPSVLRVIIMTVEPDVLINLLCSMVIPEGTAAHIAIPMRGGKEEVGLRKYLPRHLKGIFLGLKNGRIDCLVVRFLPGQSPSLKAMYNGTTRIVLSFSFINDKRSNNSTLSFDKYTSLESDIRTIFRGSPLTSLSISTSASCMASMDWRALFQTFTALREVGLGVIGEDAYTSDTHSYAARAIFRALDPTFGTRRGGATKSVLCPDLEKLVVVGFTAQDNKLLRFATRCLAARKAVGSPVHTVTFRLTPPAEGIDGYCHRRREKFVAALAPLVTLCVVYEEV